MPDEWTVHRSAWPELAALVPVCSPVERDGWSGVDIREQLFVRMKSKLQLPLSHFAVRSRSPASNARDDCGLQYGETDVVQRVVNRPENEPRVAFLSVR